MYGYVWICMVCMYNYIYMYVLYIYILFFCSPLFPWGSGLISMKDDQPQIIFRETTNFFDVPHFLSCLPVNGQHISILPHDISYSIYLWLTHANFPLRYIYTVYIWMDLSETCVPPNPLDHNHVQTHPSSRFRVESARPPVLQCHHEST